MKLNKSLVLIISINSLFAQQNTTAKIEIVKENGLHKIIVPAEIRSFSKENLSDFRIFDNKGIEVPYFVIQDNNPTISSSFSEFKVISKNVIPKKKTSIIIESPTISIDQIVLSITNSDVIKSYSISGSNDQKEWFGLINNSQLYNLESSRETSIFKTIPLPLSSYHYLKIDVDDRKTLPINILKAGIFTHKTRNKDLLEIHPKSSQITQIPSQKKTRIHVVFDNLQIINQVHFEISNPSLFKRTARIFLNKTRKTKHKVETYQETLFNFELNSDIKNTFNIPQLFEKGFFIEIENQDNQPLSFSKIRFFQNQLSIMVDLKTNQDYTVKTGNPKLNTPEYDLGNFKSKIASNLPEAKIYDLKQTISQKTRPQDKSLWQQSWFLWCCIGLGGIAILYFTTSLVKDMKTNASI